MDYAFREAGRTGGIHDVEHVVARRPNHRVTGVGGIPEFLIALGKWRQIRIAGYLQPTLNIGFSTPSVKLSCG